MQFSALTLLASVAALCNAAQFTNSAFTGITAGSPFTITWSSASGAVTILLKDGESTNLQTVATIASAQTGTSFTWTPSSSLAAGTYAFQINDDSGVNYSAQFPISGATGVASSSAASSTSASSSASSSAASSSSAATTSASSSSAASSSSVITSTASSSLATTLVPVTSSNATTTATSSSVSGIPSASGNSTILSTSASLTSTKTKSASSSTASGTSGSVPTTAANSAAGLASPIAMVFLAFAAFMTLN